MSKINLIHEGSVYIRVFSVGFQWGFRKYDHIVRGGWVFGPFSYVWHRHTPFLELILKAAKQTNEELAS